MNYYFPVQGSHFRETSIFNWESIYTINKNNNNHNNYFYRVPITCQKLCWPLYTHHLMGAMGSTASILYMKKLRHREVE